MSQLKEAAAAEPLVTLDQLPMLGKVPVKVKIISMSDVVAVSNDQENAKVQKQECVVADATGCTKVVLWNYF